MNTGDAESDTSQCLSKVQQIINHVTDVSKYQSRPLALLLYMCTWTDNQISSILREIFSNSRWVSRPWEMPISHPTLMQWLLCTFRRTTLLTLSSSRSIVEPMARYSQNKWTCTISRLIFRLY